MGRQAGLSPHPLNHPADFRQQRGTPQQTTPDVGAIAQARAAPPHAALLPSAVALQMHWCAWHSFISHVNKIDATGSFSGDDGWIDMAGMGQQGAVVAAAAREDGNSRVGHVAAP